MLKIIRLAGNDPNSPLTLRLVISSKHSYRIIGLQGAVHKAIQSRCDVNINLAGNLDERIGHLCSVTGTASNIARAMKEIVRSIFNKKPLRIWISLLIPSALASKLQQIPATNGTGCILNDIATETNTRIIIEPTPLVDNTTEHILKVSAATDLEEYLDNFGQAMTLIGSQFLIHRREALSPNNVYYTPFCQHQPPITNTDEETGSQQEYVDKDDSAPSINKDMLINTTTTSKDDSPPFNPCSTSSVSSPYLPFSSDCALECD